MAINRHGISKDATKADLKKIRSNPNASKGAKNLAHWKLNMHHNEEHIQDFGESLKDWFGKGKKGDWVRVGTDGKIKGQCAREPGEGKPKCMPRSKAHSMEKKDRASAARRKRAKDPSVDRPGTGNKPINVKTDKKDVKEGVIGGAIGGAVGGAVGGFSGAVTGAKVGSAVGDAAAIGAGAYGAYKVGKGAVKAGKAVGKGIKKLKPKPKNEETKYTLHAKDITKVKERLAKKIDEKCWDGWVKRGMKKKGNRMVPNCVKETSEYDATPGGMEWGTDKGDDYYRKLTPGQEPKRRDLKGNKTTIKPVKVPFNSPGITEESSGEQSKKEYPINNEKETFDKGDPGHFLTGKDGDWYIEELDVKELEQEVENYTFDDAVEDGLYDEDELIYDDFDNTPGFDNEVEITEALSVQGRLKRRFNARRNKQKLKVARRIALRRGSTPDRLKRRATRGARLMVYKRLLRGRDRAGLPPAEKARLERMVQRFQPLVSRISVKLLPQMRKNEIKRLTARGKLKAKSSKKFKPARSISTSSKKTKKFVIKKGGSKTPKPKKPKKFVAKKPKSGAAKAYKAFSFSVA